MYLQSGALKVQEHETNLSDFCHSATHYNFLLMQFVLQRQVVFIQSIC